MKSRRSRFQKSTFDLIQTKEGTQFYRNWTKNGCGCVKWEKSLNKTKDKTSLK